MQSTSDAAILPVMPKGVEHAFLVIVMTINMVAILPVMPKGVEHPEIL